MTNKDTNSQDSIQVGNESIQTNTLGTTMEEKTRYEIMDELKSMGETTPLLSLTKGELIERLLKIQHFRNIYRTDLLNALIEREEGEKVTEDYPSSWHRENASGYNQAKTDTINHLKSLRDE